METAIPTDRVEQVEEQDRQEAGTESVARTATPRKMFKFSDFIDVGEGALECEHARDGECENEEHFHAWCRLPNQFQRDDIRGKGLAAKAARIRLLRDPASDASIVIDEELARIADPVYLDALIDEIVGREFPTDYLEAQADLEEREEFEHIVQEREEYTRLQADEKDLPEDEQSDEYKQLSKHMENYLTALRERLKEVQDPKREELRAREPEAIASLVRAARVEEEANRAFMETYNAWMWFVGTYHVELHPLLKRPFKGAWEEIGRRDRAAAGTMFGEADEVIEALKATYQELQLALQRGSTGNS